MRPSRCLPLVVALLLVLMAGCDTVAPDEAEPPELIPAQAFTMQTDLFRQSRSGHAQIGPHFMAAVMRAWPVATTLDARLQLPARLTQAALRQAPTIDDAGAWVWTSSVPVEGQPVTFILRGQAMGAEVDWTMEVVLADASAAAAPRSADPSAAADSASSPALPPLAPPTLPAEADTTASDTAAASPATTVGADAAADDDRPGAATPPSLALPTDAPADSTFVLYTARTDSDGQAGHWRLFDTIDGERVHVLRADFEIEKTTKKQVTLTVPPTAPEHSGDSIVYAHDGDQRRLRWVRAREGTTHRITWNAQSHKGAITATNYNDGQTACWSPQLDNTACSSE